jgi:hypothetical protein
MEKVYFIAGPEFGNRAGHTMVIMKALYGLRSSGARWHDKFGDILTDMGLRQSRMETDTWMRMEATIYNKNI